MKKYAYILLFVFLIPALCLAGPQTASSTLASAIIDKAETILDDESNLIWDTTELLEYLNEGTIDIVEETGCYQGTEAITLVADTVEYTPTTAYLGVVSAVINPASGASYGLKKGNVTSRAFQISDDQPEFFYEFAGKVGIYPAYSSVTTETATVYFIKRPVAVASNANVLVPAALDKALIYYIVGHSLLRDRRPQEAQNYLAWYQRELNQYRREFSEVDNETSEPVR